MKIKNILTLTLFLLLLGTTPISAYENVFSPHIGAPEILVDAPWRIESNVNLIPVLVFFHDFDDSDNNYTLNSVYVYDMNNNGQSVNIYNSGGSNIGNTLGELPLTVNDYVWYRIVYVNKTELTSSANNLKVNVTLYGSGQYGSGPYPFEFVYNISNITNSFTILSPAFSLPSLDGSWYCGDTHHHTIYSDNAVEFGAPINATKIMGDVIGLDWVILTDHSFDLDSDQGFVDVEDKLGSGDYINETAKWNSLKSECNNIDGSFKCLVGEEASARNSNNKYVDLLVYNISGLSEAIKGEDGGGVWRVDFLLLNPQTFLTGLLTDFGEHDFEVERNYNNYTSAYTPNLSQAISEASSVGGFAYYAHPIEAKHWLYNLITSPVNSVINYGVLNRDEYTNVDFNNPNYIGLELWNGRAESSMNNLDVGIHEWSKLMIKNLGTSRKIFVEGGSDAHGDFNYIRAAKTAWNTIPAWVAPEPAVTCPPSPKPTRGTPSAVVTVS